MARFELNIYNDHDEIVKRFETDRVRWGIFMQALELEETLKGASTRDMIAAVNAFVKKIFVEATDADLQDADVEDLLNTIKQVANMGKKLGISAKNGGGAA